MLQIECPYCGVREMAEFSCHGEAHIARPLDPHNISDQAWGDYVFFRTNPKGDHYERWIHTHGCRKWFNVARNTISDHIYASYKVSDKKPELPPKN